MPNYPQNLLKEVAEVSGRNPFPMLLNTSITLAKAAAIVAYPLMLGKSLSQMDEDDDESANFIEIAPWITGYAGLWVASELAQYVQQYILHPVSMDMSYRMTHRIMDTFYALPMEARSSNTNAPAVQHFNAAYEHLGNAFITSLFTRTIPSVLEVLVIDAMVAYQDLRLGGALLGIVVSYTVAAIICSKYISDSQNQYLGSLCEAYEFIIDQLDQYENAHYYNNVSMELQRLDIAMRKLSTDFEGSLAFKSITSSILSILFGFGYVATLIYTAYLFDEDMITTQQIIILMLYILQSGMSLRALSDSLGGLVGNYENFKRLVDYLDAKPKAVDYLDKDVQIAKEQASIEFRKVSFNYGDEKSNLSSIEFKLDRGSVTAIVGRSGSGKSTLTRLLMGFYAPNSGEIYLGSQNVARAEPESLRHNFAVVPQTPVIFSGSIMDNIRYGNMQAKDHEVIAAAEKAGLGDLVRSDRLTEVAGSGGRKLSGGQKQRISIARAYLRGAAPYLILDEPTSALDSATETEVLVELNKLIIERGVTVVIVTHNLDKLREHIKIDGVIDVDNYAEQFKPGPIDAATCASNIYTTFRHSNSDDSQELTRKLLDSNPLDSTVANKL